MNETIKNLLAEVDKAVADKSFGKEPEALYEPIHYILSLGGKRLRPLLSLLAYRLYREDHRKAMNPAMAIEVFHNFTLMHDDIMDEAPLRRGKATVHEKWDNNTAILSGDVMLVKAYDLLLEIDPQILPEVLKAFNQTAAEVCEGQQMDMLFETRTDVTEDEYLEMIRLKTAVLLGHSLWMGGKLAGADAQQLQALYDFGQNIGIGFQLKDDLLDVYADKAKFGKQVGGDILSNKKTFLLIQAKNLANEEQAAALEKWLSTYDNPEEKVKAVTALYNEMQIRELTEEKMNSYFERAMLNLKQLKSNNQALEDISTFTAYLLHREK